LDEGRGLIVSSMPAVLPPDIVAEENFVLSVRRVRETERAVREMVVIESLCAIGVVCICHELVRSPATVRSKEPEPIALDWTAEGEVDVVYRTDRVLNLEALRDQICRLVVGLHRVVRPCCEHRAVEIVAALFGDHVDANAADSHFGRQRAGLIADLLVVEIVVIETGLVAVAKVVVDDHAVLLVQHVARIRAMHLQRGLLHPLCPADIRRGSRDTWYQLPDRKRVAT
jgi:hypothetical protein